MRKVAIIFCILFFGTLSTTHSQDVDIDDLTTTIQTLETLDSLNTVKIDLQSEKIEKYKEQSEQDSLLLSYKDKLIDIANQERDIYKKYANLYKPKWYENKHLWFFLGSGTTILTGWVFINMNN